MNAKKVTPFLENVAESTTACLITMVQGNVLALGLGHWLVASQTGLVAGGVASAAILLARTKRRWVVSLTLGVVTGVVDYFMHPGAFGPEWAEAFVTGVAAAALSLTVGTVWQRMAKSRTVSEEGAAA